MIRNKAEDEDDLPVIRNPRRQDAVIAIDFTANTAKEYYDSNHTPVYIKKNDFAYLRLHHGYHVPSVTRKLGKQRTGLFRIMKMIGPLACKLQLPPDWKIHPVVSIAHLSLASAGKDPFNRPLPHLQEPVEGVEGDEEEWKLSEIEAVLGKRVRHKRTEYLIKWLGYSNKHNQWYPENLLENAKELIQQYNDLFPPTKTHWRCAAHRT